MSSKILLVEDEKFLVSVLKRRLEKQNLTVLVAEDGEAALEILKTEQPDLVLLDVMLPKKTGFEVLEEMRSNPLLNRSKVIIISNLRQEGDIVRGKSLGAIAYFPKADVSIDDLMKEIVSAAGSAPKQAGV